MMFQHDRLYPQGPHHLVGTGKGLARGRLRPMCPSASESVKNEMKSKIWISSPYGVRDCKHRHFWHYRLAFFNFIKAVLTSKSSSFWSPSFFLQQKLSGWGINVSLHPWGLNFITVPQLFWNTVYSLPSLLMGSASANSTNCWSRIFGEKTYVVADMYYVVRSRMVVSVLNTHIPSFFSFSLNNTA